MKDLLIEILVEEIPANFAVPAIVSFQKIFETLLKNNSITYKNCTNFTTPRRLALLITELSENAKDELIETKGPMYDVAFNNGEPTKVGIGFFSANNLDINTLKNLDENESIEKPFLKEINGKKYIFIKKEKKGEITEELIRANLERILSEINFNKKMRWADKDFPFVRPIRGITLLYGSTVIDAEVAGIKTGNKLTGHRLLSPEFEVIKNPSDYEDMMMKKNVMVNRDKRLEYIKNAIDEIEKKYNASAVDKNKVANIVVDLVEYPYLLSTEFDEKFLEVPDEVLISEMIEHQKYFPLKDKNGKLTNIFIITANQPETPFIIAGNIRVLAARLSDGRFLYQEDLKNGLDEMNKRLSMLLFRANMGSVLDKVERLKKNTPLLIKLLGIEDKKDDVITTLNYMKSDLVSNMVYNFPELQGIMGSYFATYSGFKSEIALSIKEHYQPIFSGDIMPSNDLGKTASILDKLDNIISGFYVGDIPTGSQDPNGLRRQALGIINILISSEKHIDIRVLIENMISTMPEKALKNDSKNLVDDILVFFKSRFENELNNKFSHDAIYGVLATGVNDIYDSYLKIVAVDSFRQTNKDLFDNLLTIFKRINNIIKKSDAGSINETILKEDAEKNLYSVYKTKLKTVNDFINSKNYENAFKELSEIYEPLGKFFDDVMVMDKDETIKNNRIALLASIDKLFKTMLDFSVLIK